MNSVVKTFIILLTVVFIFFSLIFMNRKKIKEKSRTLPVSHAGMGKPKPILSIINEYKSSVFVNIEDEWQQVNLNFEDSYQGFLKKLEERIKRLQNERK